MKLHEKYILRCIELARNGLGTTYPNPLVGSVIVYEDRIIGEGWHYKAGQPHAEVNAINSVKDKSLLPNATIYVSLEPCSHFGKTPPCADLIITNQFRDVVIGSSDPNPKVAGNGIKKLKEAGCKVISGVLKEECEDLNKRFFTFQLKKRPYIFLKWAQTTHGFIAPFQKKEQKPVWITNALSRQQVHRMRAQEQAILVGTNTVMEDNPSLTTRDWTGNSPIRIILDRRLRIPSDYHIYNSDATTIIITEKTAPSKGSVHFETLNFKENIPQQISNILYTHQVQSLLVEGGAKTLQTFIDAGFWDEAYVFNGALSLKEGIKAPNFSGRLVLETPIKNNTVSIYKNRTT